MSCSACSQTKTVGQCPESLVIGTVPYNTTAMRIYFKNMATGRMTVIDATSSNAGLLTADLTDIDFVREQDYEVWTSRTTDSLETQSTITISGTGYSCLIVRFARPLDSAGSTLSYDSQTLTIQS